MGFGVQGFGLQNPHSSPYIVLNKTLVSMFFSIPSFPANQR